MPTSRASSPRPRGSTSSCKNGSGGHSQHEPDAFLFPGILVLVLAAIAIVELAARRRAACATTTSAFYLLIAVIATLMFVAWPFELWDTCTGCPA